MKPGSPSRGKRRTPHNGVLPPEGRAAVAAEIAAHRAERGYALKVAERLGCSTSALKKWMLAAGCGRPAGWGVAFSGADTQARRGLAPLPKAARPGGLRGRCGITGEKCPWWLDCAWNAVERVKCGSDSAQKNGFARIEACAVAIREKLSSCAACRERGRCAEAWRCFRAERLRRAVTSDE